MDTEKLALLDFVKKQSVRFRKGLIKEGIFDEEGSPMSFSDQAAVVTHYLMLQDSKGDAKTYESKAQEIMQYWEMLLANER